MPYGYGNYIKDILMKSLRFIAILSFAICFFTGASLATEYYSAWPYSKLVCINTTSSGSFVAGDVPNFPLLIKLDGSNFPFEQAKGD
jgi:hypothetical protein